ARLRHEASSKTRCQSAARSRRMRVRRNFEALYRKDNDPWKIGLADSERYDSYFSLLSSHARGSVLDIGCGTGAFLARCATTATKLIGVEVSATAIEIGRAQWPAIEFLVGSADRLDDIRGLREL